MARIAGDVRAALMPMTHPITLHVNGAQHCTDAARGARNARVDLQ
jgi:hypothetical protein